MAQIPTTYKSIFFYLMFVLSGTISFIGYSQDIPSKRLENVTTKLSYEEIQDLEYEALIDEDSAALEDLSGKPEPGMKRFRHLCGISEIEGGGFSLVSGACE